MGDVAHAADHGKIAALVFSEAMKIFEQIDGGLQLVDHGIERGQRIGGVAAARFAVLCVAAGFHDALRDRPDEQVLVSRGGDFAQAALDPFFFPRDDIHDRVTSADQHIKLLLGGQTARGGAGWLRIGRGRFRDCKLRAGGLCPTGFCGGWVGRSALRRG